MDGQEKGDVARAVDKAWGLIRNEMELYSEHCVKNGIATSEDANWYCDNKQGPFALVTEIVDEQKLRRDDMIGRYKNDVGQWGGLSPELHNYRRRIVISIEGHSGYYLTSRLHMNNHYGIQCSEDRLKRYLGDAVRMGLSIEVVTSEDSGKVGHVRKYMMPAKQDVLIITPGNTVVVVDNREADGEQVSIAFMNLSDINMSESEKKNMKSLNHERAIDFFMSNTAFGDAYGAKERNQPTAINYQFAGMNSTDRDHKLTALTGKCAPKLTSRYDGISPGWNEKSLVDDIAKSMVNLTRIAESMAANTGVATRPFSDSHSNEHFASKIHPHNHLTGYTSTLTPVDADNELCAHIDRNNSTEIESNQVVGSYFYKQIKKGSEIKNYRMYHGGRCVATCSKMASNATKIERLSADLIGFIDKLPEHRKSLPPKCDSRFRRYSNWNPKDGIVTGVHLFRTVFCSLFASCISDWIQDRFAMGIEVHMHELYEAISTITRGGAPESWYLTWKVLVSRNGYKLKAGEKKMKRNDESTCAFKQNHDIKQHHNLDETMTEQFDKISVCLHGGLERGSSARRVQPVVGSLVMDVSKSYAMTPRSLKETTQWLNEEAQSLQAKSGNLSDSSALQKLAREFVKRISKPVTSGGMLHVGEFFAMIILHVLALLGLIPAEFLTCCCFARESGTCAFLLKEYGLAVKDDKLIDILAGKQYFKERYNSMARLIVENGLCEMKRSHDAGNDPNGGVYSEFLRTDGDAVFAKEVENGRVIFLDNQGNIKYLRLVFSTDAVTQSGDNEILLVVSKDCLQCRSFQWWAPRVPVTGQLGNLDLRQIATLASENDLYFSNVLADTDFSDVIWKAGARLARKEKQKLKEKRISVRDKRKWKKKQYKQERENTQVKDARQFKNWARGPDKPKKKDRRNDLKRAARAVMKELLLSVNLAELESIDVADVVGSSLREQIEKIVRYATEDDSWIKDEHTDLLWRCILLLDCDEETNVKEETLKGERKAESELSTLLKTVNKFAKQNDETYIPSRSFATRHSDRARGLSIPKYEFLIGVEQVDYTAAAPFDIESIAAMVDPLIKNIVFRLREKTCQFNNVTINLYKSTLSHGEVDICCSSDQVFPIKAEKDYKKRLNGGGNKKVHFAIGCVPSEPGFYLTREHAKLAVLAIFVMKRLGHERSAMFWERLFPRPITTLYPIDESWGDSIAVDGSNVLNKLPIASVIRHPLGVIFVDLHQLAYKDQHDNLSSHLRLSDSVDYCTTSPSLWDIRSTIPHDDVCVIVGICVDTWQPATGVPSSRVTRTHYYHGHHFIPDGTMAVTVRRKKQTKGDEEDTYYFLPKTNVKLRSKTECKRFKECLDSADGLEHLALAEFWRIESESKADKK